MFDADLPLDGQGGALGAVAAGLEGDPAYLDTPTGGRLGPSDAWRLGVIGAVVLGHLHKSAAQSKSRFQNRPTNTVGERTKKAHDVPEPEIRRDDLLDNLGTFLYVKEQPGTCGFIEGRIRVETANFCELTNDGTSPRKSPL